VRPGRTELSHEPPVPGGVFVCGEKEAAGAGRGGGDGVDCGLPAVDHRGDQRPGVKYWPAPDELSSAPLDSSSS
jgi:hypothetical protein